MPLTLSHPAAVLPMLRGPLVPTALVVGAISPDLPYFVQLPVTAESWHEPFVNATFSHSLEGLLLVGLPSVVLLALLFHMVRRPMLDLLPFSLAGPSRPAGKSWLALGIWFLPSALIGLATHVVWDSTTALTTDRLFQHASSVVGAIAIVVWCVRRFRSPELTIERVMTTRCWVAKRLPVILSIFLTSTVLAATSVLQAQDRDGTLGLELTLSLFLKSGLRIAAGAMVIYALVWHVASLIQRVRYTKA